MTAAKAILQLIPLMQSSIILGENIKLSKKKKMKVEDMIGVGVGTLVGIELIKITANEIEGFN